MATGSNGKFEELAEKSTRDGIETMDEKEVRGVKPVETIAFRNVDAEKETPTASSTGIRKPGIELCTELHLIAKLSRL